MQAEEKVEIAQKVQEYGERGNFDTILATSRIPYETAKGKLLANQVEIRRTRKTKQMARYQRMAKSKRSRSN